jgi:hypothetical protein
MQEENLRAIIEKLTLENKEKDAKLKEKDAELKEKDAENCIGWIIDKGLPALGLGMLNSIPSKSQMKLSIMVWFLKNLM